jgi:hypothetical protein
MKELGPYALGQHATARAFLGSVPEQGLNEFLLGRDVGEGQHAYRCTPFWRRQAKTDRRRFVRTVRAEASIGPAILSAGLLEGILTVYIDHYNCLGPHDAWTYVAERFHGRMDDRADRQSAVGASDRLGGW